MAGRMRLGGSWGQVQVQASQQQQQQLLHFQHYHLSSHAFAGGPKKAAASSPGLLLQRKLAPVLAVGDDELDITAVQELADGTLFFSFGASPPRLGRRVDDPASSRAELVAMPVAPYLPQRLRSQFKRHSPIPVLASRRLRGGKQQQPQPPPQQERQEPDVETINAGAPAVDSEAALPANGGPPLSRPASAFLKRSPIPKLTQRRRSAPDPPAEADSKDAAKIDRQVVAAPASVEVAAPAASVQAPSKDSSPSVQAKQVSRKESEEQVSGVAGRKAGDTSRRRSPRRAPRTEKETSVAPKSEKETSVVTKNAAAAPTTAAAAAAQAPLAILSPVAPSRPPSKFVRRSPIPALSNKRSAPTHPSPAAVVVQAQEGEAVVAENTVVRQTVVKETVLSTTRLAQTPVVEAVVKQETVIAVSVSKVVQTPARPKSSFVRRSPISGAKVAKTPSDVVTPEKTSEGGAGGGASAGIVDRTPEADVKAAAKVVEADDIVPEPTAQKAASAVLPKSSASTRTRTKQPPAKAVAQSPPSVQAAELPPPAKAVAQSPPSVQVAEAPPPAKPVAQSPPAVQALEAPPPAKAAEAPPPARPVAQRPPAVQAAEAPVLDSDSESEADDQGIGSLAASSDATLASSTLPELKKIAKARGLKGYSKLKKSELIELLQSSSTS